MDRTFTLADQRRFAELSGDHNPLHLDAAVARRSMLGGLAVHGVHLLLWALDQLAADGVPCGFAKLRVTFDRAVVVGDAVRCDWEDASADRAAPLWKGRISSDAGTLVRISVVPAASPASPWPRRTHFDAPVCEEHDIAALADRRGALDLVLPAEAGELFPDLAAASPPVIIAALLATTRLVGMICPGLHSIYSALRLASDGEWTKPGDASTSLLQYRVTRADPRVRLLDIAVEAGPLRGTVSAFVRPKPFRQPSLAQILKFVPPRAFAGQHAIVIGGSRGLGELAAKLLCAGGARVTLTWHKGESDAMAIAREAAALGFEIATKQFDVLAPPSAVAAHDTAFTHLYYFATPRIPQGRPGHFNPAVFATLVDGYVNGLARTVDWFRPAAAAGALVWYPSTVFLSEATPGFAEYCAAKACGEALCARLASELAPMRFTAPRLPRLPTDQTQSLTELTMADGAATLLAALLDVGQDDRHRKP